MTTALTVRNADIDLDTLQRTAKMLVASNFFDTKGAVEVAIAQIATKIIAGSEFGFGTFASVNGIHVIQGKPAIGAGLMASGIGIPAAGYFIADAIKNIKPGSAATTPGDGNTKYRLELLP